METDLIASLNEMKAGKSGAFERFFALVEKRVFAFGLKVCGHVEDAKDTVQETLLSAFKALPNLDFKDSKALNVWLYKVAKNSCLMMRRKSAYQPDQELSLDQEHLQDCEPCQRFIATLRKTVELCRESGADSPPQSLFSPEEIAAFKAAYQQAALDLARQRGE